MINMVASINLRINFERLIPEIDKNKKNSGAGCCDLAKNEQKKQKTDSIFSFEMTGMLLALFSLMGLLCLITGETVFFTLGAAVQKFLLGVLGFAAFPVLVFFLFIGIKLVVGFKLRGSRAKLAIGMFFVYLLLAGIIVQTATTAAAVSGDFGEYISYCYFDKTSSFGHTAGGIFFGILAYPLCALVKPVGTYVICSVAIALITFFVFKKRVKTLAKDLSERRERKADEKAERELQKKTEEFTKAQARAAARGIESQSVLYPRRAGEYSASHGRMRENAASEGVNPAAEKNAAESEGYPSELDGLKGSYQSGGLSAIYSDQKFNLKTKKEMLRDDDRQTSLKLLFGEKKAVKKQGEYASNSYPNASLYGEPRSKIAPQPSEREEVRNFSSYQSEYGDDLAAKLDYIRRPTAPDYREPVKSPMGGDIPESVAMRERLNNIDQSVPDRDVYVIGGGKERESISAFDARVGRTAGMTGDINQNNSSGRDIAATDSEGFNVNFSDGERFSASGTRGAFADRNISENNSEQVSSEQRINFNYSEADDEGAQSDYESGRSERNDISSIRGINAATGTATRAPREDVSGANLSSDYDLGGRMRQESQPEGGGGEESGADRFTRRVDYGRAEQIGMGGIGASRASGSSNVGSSISVSDDRKLENPIDCIPQNYRYHFAPFNLMRDYRPDAATIAATKREQESRKGIILQVLANAGVSAQIVDVKYGPALTRFELTIPIDVSVKKITELQKDFNFRIAAPGTIRILAPITGTSRIGIEVPNTTPATVGLKDLVTDPSFKNAKKSSLTFCLGKDLVGNPVNLDLSKMPHLLVAGATGTGKSVFLNTLLVSLMYKYTPEELRIVLVDPKIVEFSLFKGVPNLLFDEIITETPKACAMLDWACKEMDDRYRLLNENLVKNVDEYNTFMQSKGGKPLYKILIIIDEFADLMATSTDKKNIENKISRIAAKARAAGIHLIMATQRPSVDIMEGSIKTNFTSRVAFKMSSPTDAQVIMGEIGAEKLLGRGDVLYRTSNMMSMERAQGAFIDTPEIDAVCKYLREHNKCFYNEFALDEINKAFEKEEAAANSANATDVLGGDGTDGNNKSDDEIIKNAMRLAINMKNISISMMQRRLGIGYPRAGKIMDILVDRKYVSDSLNSRNREINMTKQDFEQVFGEPFDNTDGAV